MADFTTSDPRTGGRPGPVGSTVLYVATVGPTAGSATLLYKHGTGDTAWCTLTSGEGGEPVTADPRSGGLARPVGSVVLYVTGGVGTRLIKYGILNTDWCTYGAAASSGGLSDGDYGDVLVGGGGTSMAVQSIGGVAFGSAATTAATDYAPATPNVISADFTVAAGYSHAVTQSLEVADGINLEVGDGGYIEVT